MNTNEEKLRKRYKDRFIGCFHRKNNDEVCFDDIRGEYGEMVEYPDTHSPISKIKYNGSPLEEGVFYSFEWHLENQNIDSIVIDGLPKKVDSKDFIENFFHYKSEQDGKQLQSEENIQRTIINEVNGAQHTFIYELLQNANDYKFQDEKVNVKFILTEHYLFFMHSGDYFNLRNIIGICGINEGEKKGNKETIGYKGIGFKTVFLNNEYVYLHSGEWSLRFDKKYSKEITFGRCPWTLMPIYTKVDELDEEARNVILRNDMRVQFALKHKSDARKNLEQLDKVFCDNQILLFIPNVHDVEVIVGNEVRYHVKKDDTKWFVSGYEYTVPLELKEWIKKNVESDGKIPKKFENIDKVSISFAVGRDGNFLCPIENARVYNYLPTDLQLGFCFIFNADFIPNANRGGLHFVEWNDRIMEQCGCQFADWWVSFLVNEKEYDMNSVFNILPQFDSRDNYAKLFIKGFSKRIVDIPCIPVLKDGNYHLVTLEETIYDGIEFIACDNPVLSDEEFYEFSDMTGCLPHSDVRCNKKLKTLLSHYNKSNPFSLNELRILCTESDFMVWLTKGDNDYDFVSYLLNHDLLNDVKGYKLFLTADCNLATISSLYYDLDKYIEDLSFLANRLPRINVNLREKISSNPKWANYVKEFKEFNVLYFVKNIFDNFSDYGTLLQQKENSIHFVHFLSIVDVPYSLPDKFPFVIDDGTIVLGNSGIYQANNAAAELKAHSWFDDRWMLFIHNDYFSRDEDKVRYYIENKCGIQKLTIEECYKNFIANITYAPQIAERINEGKINVDFYRYLSSIKDNIRPLSNSIKNIYRVFVTDGKHRLSVPLSTTIYKNDTDWKKMASASWMPEDCCLAISDMYFDNLSELEVKKLQSFFFDFRISIDFSVKALCKSPQYKLDSIFAKITDEDKSIEFLDFLFRNKDYVFTGKNDYDAYQSIPIKCKDSEVLSSIKSYWRGLYITNEDAIELYNQPWFDRKRLYLCDDSYKVLFDGNERCNFFEQLGLNRFDKIKYIREQLFPNLIYIKDNFLNKQNNIAFHHYIADIHGDLTENDFNYVKNIPIYISSPNTKGGVLDDKSTGHYMPSDLLNDIISKDLVPISIMDSIHPDYVRSDNDRDYFIKKLDNEEIDEDGFFDYIVNEDNKEQVMSYLKDESRNVRFWRWVCESKVDISKKKGLAILPMMVRNGYEDCFISPASASLYISDDYTTSGNIESFICEYVDKPLFVSSVYIEEDKSRDWTYLFKALKIKVDNKDIVFKNIIPNLDRYKNSTIVNVLADYVDEITKRLDKKDDDFGDKLSGLQLLCNDGKYRNAKDVVVSGDYFEIKNNCFSDVIIANQVSECYIRNCGENENKRCLIIKLIAAVANYFSVNLDNHTKYRNAKINYYFEHQKQYLDTESHFHIITELAKDYNDDCVVIGGLIQKCNNILLFDTKGDAVCSNTMYLSETYKPDCQYMANDITELSYLSEDYSRYCSGIDKRFFHTLGVKDGFDEQNLALLVNKRFSEYFWSTYANSHREKLEGFLTKDKLHNLSCIPTSTGVKRPIDLYDNKKQLKEIVLKLANGESKLPSVEIPDWIGDIGFRNKLYILDCLEYLNLNIPDFRRDVMKWIANTPKEMLSRYEDSIKNFAGNAKWINGSKHWVSLQSLVALEFGNATLRDNFGGNDYVCRLEGMPDDEKYYNKICNLFGIKILTNDDFRKAKEGGRTDSEAVEEISKRLLYLAYKADKDNWKELYEEYKRKLLNADVSSCERILYYYNDYIRNYIHIYAEEEKKLWYVGSYNGPMFRDVLEWLKNKIGVIGDFDKSFLDNLFLGSFEQTIASQEGGSLPAEVLSYLDEEDRQNIGVDTLCNAESINEEDCENDYPVNYEYSSEMTGVDESDTDNHEDVNTHYPSSNDSNSHNHSSSGSTRGHSTPSGHMNSYSDCSNTMPSNNPNSPRTNPHQPWQNDYDDNYPQDSNEEEDTSNSNETTSDTRNGITDNNRADRIAKEIERLRQRLDELENGDGQISQVNQTNNYIGELIYESYLLKLGKKYDYASLRGVEDYDFEIIGEKTFVEVCTHQYSIKDGVAPFRLLRSQIEFMQMHPDSKYHIVRISLDDLNIKYRNLYDTYGKEANPMENDNLRRACKKLAEHYWMGAKIEVFEALSPEYEIKIVHG